MSNYILNIVNSKIEYIKSSYEANKLVKHQGIKGNLNEILLRDMLQDLIPSKYRFTNGVIQDCAGFQSNESDIIIYDNEILPTILFGGELGFVPSESVKYNFEVKSTLSSTEVKNTVRKFSHLRNCLNYDGVNSLFAFSSDLHLKNELERYYKIDESEFLQNPAIRVLMIVNKGYYFFNSERIYLKDLVSKNEFAKTVNTQSDGRFKVGNCAIDVKRETKFDIKGDFIINGLNYEDIYLDRYFWCGSSNNTKQNEYFLSFLSGVSNTLSQGTFGKYLTNEKGEGLKVFSECIVDMWGNSSHKKVNFDGINESVLSKCKYSFSLTECGKANKIEIYPQT